LVGAVLATVASGGSIVCPPGFMAASFFDWLGEFAPSWYTAVPTIHRDILARGGRLAAPPDRGSLRFVRSCSAPMPRPLIAEVEGFFGVPVVEAYGMTEASHQIAINPLPPGVRKPGSVGLPAGTEVAAIDDAGTLLRRGSTGEIVVRGPGVTAGYSDPEGYIFLTARTKEIINRGGAKVSPREVDDALAAHPAVAEAIAFAMPDPRLGEDVAAAVVLRPGAVLDERQLRDFAAQHLAEHKLPRRIVFLDALPRGATGKLQRVGLAEKLGIVAEAGIEPAAFAPPRSPTEETLAALWRQYLRLDRLGIHDNFFDAGGDSLSASLLVVEIERALSVQLSVAELFEAPTIAELAARLADEPSAAKRPRLSRIQPHGERTPFFCIGAGPTMRVLGLRLAPDQPFLGPQYPDFAKLPHPCQLEDIAAYHVATIRAEQPQGPYFLGGWCVDGLVAYEVGRQLREQGETVGLLVMFDVPSPRAPGDPRQLGGLGGKFTDAIERVRLHLQILRKLPWGQRPAYSWGRLKAAYRFAHRRVVQLNYSLRLRVKLPAAVRNELAIQHRAAQLYRLRPTDSPILVVRRTLRPGGRQREASAGWTELARGRLDIVEIPGDHRDMFLEPQVGNTAARLSEFLAAAQVAALRKDETGERELVAAAD
jgi:thioesterase domain-containing protein/acyl carrier protein